VSIWVAAIGLLVWMIQWTLLGEWYRNAVGWRLMGIEVCLELLLVLSCINLADPKFVVEESQRWYGYFSAAVLLLIALIVVQGVIAWELLRQKKKILKKAAADASRTVDSS
jgi:dipeptide/tripeptide permease